MPEVIDVPIPIDASAVAALADARTRAAMGRLVSRVLRPRLGPRELAQATADVKAEGRYADLADAGIGAELDAYNLERRSDAAA